MGKDLVPGGRATERTGGVPASLASPGEISTRSSGQLEYSAAEIIGFEHVPAQVVRQLHYDNVIAEAEIAAWAEQPVTKRRKDGSVYQVIAAPGGLTAQGL